MPRVETPGRILLLAAEACREPLKTFLENRATVVQTLPDSTSQLSDKLLSDAVDMVIFSIERPDSSHIRHMHYISEHAPKPLIVFAHECPEAWIMDAVSAGANSIVIDGLEEKRLKGILEVAAARFQRCMKLQKELDSTRQKLAERRDVERAKGILMKKRQLPEDEAYHLLRSMAMEKNQRIGEVAATLIMAAELLD